MPFDQKIIADRPIKLGIREWLTSQGHEFIGE